MELTALSNDALVASLRAICCEGNRVLARMVMHLGEVEARGLHVKAACGSMFEYCVKRLGMSEGAAFRRIAAARLARRFPTLLPRIESGEIHLTALVLIRDLVTASNVDALASEVAGKSKREVQQIVARRAPKPDVPATIRKLPERPALPPVKLFAAAPVPMPPPVPMASAIPDSPARIEPLSEARYKLQLTASVELRDKLARATDLMRHSEGRHHRALGAARGLCARR